MCKLGLSVTTLGAVASAVASPRPERLWAHVLLQWLGESGHAPSFSVCWSVDAAARVRSVASSSCTRASRPASRVRPLSRWPRMACSEAASERVSATLLLPIVTSTSGASVGPLRALVPPEAARMASRRLSCRACRQRRFARRCDSVRRQLRQRPSTVASRERYLPRASSTSGVLHRRHVVDGAAQA